MQTIVFASNNPNKLKEIKAILGQEFSVLGLQDIGCAEEIPEPYDTLEENALAKARFVYTKFGYDCFADDTGLEVEALGGLPGVQSARYAGEQKSSSDNISKLLKALQGSENRNAQFRTVMALIIQGEEFLFEGTVAGRITHEPSGRGGFGYDPVFVPDGYDQNFAEMPEEEKNRLSHRFAALKKMTNFMLSSKH